MGFSVEEIRKDFPIFSKCDIVYLDNAATSQRPIQVIKAVMEYYEEYNANIHRGVHELSQRASEAYEEAHEKVAKFIGAKNWEEVIFTRNTTESINLIAYSWGLGNLKPGDEILITVLEHHSNIIPWYLISKKTGAKLKIVSLTSEGLLNVKELDNAITDKTKVVAVTMMSNVLGTIVDVKPIARKAHEVGAIIVVDGAQGVPHLPVNVRELGIDFLAFSGHKMLGPTGIGALWGRKDLLEEMEPFLGGGDMISEVHLHEDKIIPSWNKLPWKFEAGTPNIAGGIGLGAAVDYLTRIGMQEIAEHERKLLEYTFKRLEELADYIEIYGPRDPKHRGGIVSFNVKGLNPHVTATLLNEKKIAVRSGFHCAQPLHEYLGLKEGTTRASFYLYNTLEEIDMLIEALKEITTMYANP